MCVCVCVCVYMYLIILFNNSPLLCVVFSTTQKIECFSPTYTHSFDILQAHFLDKEHSLNLNKHNIEKSKN